MKTLLSRDGQALFGATPFQSMAFLDSFYSTMPAGCQDLLVRLARRSDGRTVLIMPLLMRSARGLRRIEAADLGLSDYVAPMVAPDFRPTALEATSILSDIKRILPAADLLSLKKMPAMLGGEIANPFVHPEDGADMGITTKLFPLQEGAGGLPPFRKTKYYKEGMRNYRRLTETCRDVHFHIAANADEANRQFDALLKHRRARAAELQRDDALLDPHVQRFYRGLFVHGIDAGEILFGALYADGQCIATDLGLIHQGTHHGILTSMTDGPLRRFSPGTIAFLLILDESAARGLERYDLGVGEFAYKERLKGEAVTLYEHHEALSPLGWLGVADARLRQQVRLGVRRFPHLRAHATDLRHTLKALRHRTVVTASVLLDSPVIQGAGYSTLSAL
jgi:CelD/BcsL family acetyltransferase involved in cellulose biosynthesis